MPGAKAALESLKGTSLQPLRLAITAVRQEQETHVGQGVSNVHFAIGGRCRLDGGVIKKTLQTFPLHIRAQAQFTRQRAAKEPFRRIVATKDEIQLGERVVEPRQRGRVRFRRSLEDTLRAQEVRLCLIESAE